MPKSSATSAVPYSPMCTKETRLDLPPTVEPGLHAAQAALRLGHPHALASPQADQVGLEPGHHREHIEQQPSHGVGGVVHRPPEAQADLTRRPGSAIARASGRERASRSSLVTTRVSPARHAASARHRGNSENPGPDNDQVVGAHDASTVPECRDPTALKSVGLRNLIHQRHQRSTDAKVVMRVHTSVGPLLSPQLRPFEVHQVPCLSLGRVERVQPCEASVL